MNKSQPPQALVDYARKILLALEETRPGECAAMYDTSLFDCGWKAVIPLHTKGTMGAAIPHDPSFRVLMDRDSIEIFPL